MCVCLFLSVCLCLCVCVSLCMCMCFSVCLSSVAPRKLEEGMVGAIHLWGALPGGPGRRDIYFPRGGIEEGSSTATLYTADQGFTLRIVEMGGGLRAAFHEGNEAEAALVLSGYRRNLAYCIQFSDRRYQLLAEAGSLWTQLVTINDSISTGSDDRTLVRLQDLRDSLNAEHRSLKEAASAEEDCLPGIPLQR